MVFDNREITQQFEYKPRAAKQRRNMRSKILGQFVRMLRQIAGKSRDKVAEAAGISPAKLMRLERGDIPFDDLREPFLEKVAHGLRETCPVFAKMATDLDVLHSICERSLIRLENLNTD